MTGTPAGGSTQTGHSEPSGARKGADTRAAMLPGESWKPRASDLLPEGFDESLDAHGAEPHHDSARAGSIGRPGERGAAWLRRLCRGRRLRTERTDPVAFPERAPLRIRRGLPGRSGRRITPSRLALRDLLGEALAGLLQRPARSMLTALGTVLGVGAFVAILGLTATASSQIDARFNLLTSTEVSVEDIGGQDAELVPLAFPADADARVEALHGVEAAGVYWTVTPPGGALTVRAAPVGDAAAGEQTQVVAASPGVLAAAHPHVRLGRTFDAYHDRTGSRVAVIGSALASRLGITTLDTQPAVFIGDVPFTVIGIVDDVQRKADLLLSVVVPRTTAERVWGPPTTPRAQMLISTRIGAAAQVAAEAPSRCAPTTPSTSRPCPRPTPGRYAPVSPPTSTNCSCCWPRSAWSSAPSASPTPPWSPSWNAPEKSGCAGPSVHGAGTSPHSSSPSPQPSARWAD